MKDWQQIKPLWLVLIGLLFSADLVAAERQIDVQILSKFHPKTIIIETRTRRFELPPNRKKRFEFSAPPDEPIAITVNDEITRYYRGTIQINWQENEYQIINQTPLEMYVAGVVVGELGAETETELLKAQAILARTYALNISQRTLLSDLAYHQVFKGFDHYAEAVRPTTMSTQEYVLTDKKTGQLADALFHAECGTQRYSAAHFWHSESFFAAQPLPNHANPGTRWQQTLTYNQLSQIFKPFNEIRRNEGIPITISVDEKMYPVETFRLMVNRVYGWNTLPSNEFEMHFNAQGWVFTGRGRGHLVGLCQVQARQLTQHGWSAEQLLDFFYPEQFQP